MSLKSWLDEFVPTDPEQCTTTWTEAVSCSIKIWIGKRPENVKKHNLVSEPVASCPLCIKDTIMQVKVINSGKEWPPGCSFCPIVLAAGETCGKTYMNQNLSERVEQMLQLLKMAQDYVNTHPECEDTQ